MSAHLDISLPLLPDQCYHIYNRGNEKRKIFFNQGNYQFFLKRYGEYTLNYFDTYAYCLLDNHFHILLKAKSIDEVLASAIIDFERVDSSFFNRYVMAWLRSLSSKEGKDLTVLKAESISLQELLNLVAFQEPQTQAKDPTNHPTHMEELDIKTQLCSYFLSERFRRFLLSYAKAVNK